MQAVLEGQLIRWLDLPPDKVLVTEDPKGGLVALRRISKGQAAVSVPASKWITPDTVAKSDVGPYVGQLQPWIQIALFIMSEKAKPRSIWGVYIDSLPATVETPLCWSEQELDSLLSGSQLFDSVVGYRDFFRRKYEELEGSLFSEHRDVFDETTFSLENFLWTAIVLRTKTHAPLHNDDIALVPIADQVCHQRGRGAVWKLTSGGFGRAEKALVLEAQREYDVGEAVTMDFGEESLDAELLLNHGVLDDFVTRAGFSLNLELPEGDRFFDDKADILEINGLSESQEFILRAEEEPSMDLLAFLRLINLSGSDAFLLESLFRNDAWGFLLKPVSLENETAVFSSMMDGCREAMSGYGRTISEDKMALKSAKAGSRQEKALRIRIGELEALDSTLQFFEERFGRLQKIEYYQERRLKGLGLLDEDGSSTFDSFFKDGIA